MSEYSDYEVMIMAAQVKVLSKAERNLLAENERLKSETAQARMAWNLAHAEIEQLTKSLALADQAVDCLRALNAEMVKSLEGLLCTISINGGDVGIISDRHTAKMVHQAEAALTLADKADSKPTGH